MDVRTLLLAVCLGSMLTNASTAVRAQSHGTTHDHRDPEARSVGDITRSDSIDILHTHIDLDLTQTGNGLISGHAALRIAPKVTGITTLPLDLLQLTVDSARVNASPATFQHVGELLTVDLSGSFGPADTLLVDVYYGGDPVIDASGWGGFYTLSSYQYDLGVAFDAVPHSYGRSWFPCFDNFVERCTFSFNVRTSQNRPVFANGLSISETDLGGGIHESAWSMEGPIPSYLASVASGSYVVLRDTFPSVSGAQIPVVLAARAQDTTDLKNSFIHLQDAFNTFEEWFGPYRWERVGYCLTSQGAMEHPTNISYPDFIVDGSLTNETTMAHELSHHWFGDLITCRRAEEMYINEGFADLCGSWLFREHLYGRPAYDQDVRVAHHTLVAQVHLQDGGSYALNDIPQPITYGEHSYRKGADVGRTLRSVLGDSLFSEGFKRVFANNAFSDMSSEELRDSLIAGTGYDLNDFFDNWIFQPGWATFEVDSFDVQPNGNLFSVTVFVEQKLRFANTFYQGVPVTVTFQHSDGTIWNAPQLITLSDSDDTFTIDVPFAPAQVFLNDDERLALASTVHRDTLVDNGGVNFALADVQLTVNAMPSPAPLRIEEYWVAADQETEEPFAYVVSPDRWWRVSGSLPAGAQVTGRINIDGRSNSATLYDPGLIQDAGGVVFSEDSLVLLYRPDAHSPWVVRASELSFLGSHTDGYARISFDDMTIGDYTIGWHKSSTGIPAQAMTKEDWSVFPNPANESVKVVPPRFDARYLASVEMIDAKGVVLDREHFKGNSVSFDTSHLPNQTVRLIVKPRKGKPIDLGEVMIIH